MSERTCYCPTCGNSINIPPDLAGGAQTVCPSCEGFVEFPGGAALWFDKASELLLKSQDLQQLRRMRAQIRQQKAQAQGMH